MTSKPTLRAAVIGVGYLGRFHAQKYKALNHLAELVGVCDLNSEQAQKVAVELSVRAFTNPRDLLGKVDVVTIACVTRAHYEMAKLFLENGVHVNLEKPMTVTVQEADELIAIAKKKNLKLAVGHIERFNPTVVAIKDLLQKPKLIELNRFAPFKWRGADVNVVLDLMIHDIDLVLSYAQGSPLQSLSATASRMVTDVWDTATAHMTFQNGMMAQINVSRVSPTMIRQMRVLQEGSTILANLGNAEYEIIKKHTNASSADGPFVEAQKFTVEKTDALLSETKSFLEAVHGQKPLVVTGEDGRLALEVAEKVLHDIQKR